MAGMNERFAASAGLTEEKVYSAGMLLMQAQTPRMLSTEDQIELGRDLIEIARQMRVQRATIKALSEELLEEQALPAPSAAVLPFVREVR